ncbi:MAG: GNAT family N-acetyltransferase [Flavobacteriaceae bacterium]|nr:MAG: GNAT family N-acetyltransferase [Flavobacteriaceae bacterium]
MQKLLTDNLTLREIKAKDVFGYSELFADKETMDLFGGPTVNNDLEISDVIATKRKEYENGTALFWTITETEEREFIGFVRLMSYNSYYFDASFSSMGELRNSPELLNYIDKENGWEIDYALLKEFRNNGFMTEALSAVLDYCKTNSIRVIYAKVNSMENKATTAVLLKNDFVEHLPQANQKGGLGMIYKWENK